MFGKLSQVIKKPSALVKPEFQINSDGIWVFAPKSELESSRKPMDFETAVWHLRVQLVETQLAFPVDNNEQESTNLDINLWQKLFVPFSSLKWLKEGFSGSVNETTFDPILSELLPSITEWTLKVEPNTNVLVSKDLKLDISFWLAGQEIYPKRLGPWLTSYGQASLLTETQWVLCQIVDQFNSCDNKSSEFNFSALAKLYELLGIETSNNIQLEAILEDTVIIAPSRITIGWQQDSNSSESTQSAYPVICDLPYLETINEEQLEKAFREEFFQYDKGQPTYALPLGYSEKLQNKRLRILLTPDLQEAVTHIRRSMRGLRKELAQTYALDPDKHFEGICSPDVLALDLSTYGPRVTGLGPLVFRPVLKVRSLDRVCLLDDGWDKLTSENESSVFLELEAQSGVGEPVMLSYEKDLGLIITASEIIDNALEDDLSTVTISDGSGTEVTLLPTPQLSAEFKKAVIAIKGSRSKNSTSSSRSRIASSHDRHLTTLSNEEQKLYDELSNFKRDKRTMLERFERPTALLDHLSDGKQLQLAHYQQEGIAWLQTAFLSGKPGVLLADDMGLGKTLQVLTFLAWLLESGWNHWQTTSMLSHWEANPISTELKANQQYIVNSHPILVVVPKMLMENWENEIAKFFKNKGSIFSNFVLLDSKEVKKYTLPHANNGNDFKVGEARLNLDLIKSNRLVVANYDTVKNYYHSFSKIPWSCLVMDESQELKNPGTAITHAISCVATNSRFKITMTGTPIENDLMDIWSLFDIAAPGLLSSAKEFKHRYFLGEQASSAHGWQIDELKSTLGCVGLLKEPQPSSFVLGRNKKDFLGDELQPLVDVHEAQLSGIWPNEVASLDIPCQYQYTHQEWCQQKEILDEIARESKRGKALKAVQYIKSFSEHPWLATLSAEPVDRLYSSKNLLKNSSKFQWLVNTLELIQKRKEKVLIFTRSVQMQTWIYNFLKEKYNFDFRPINGAISGKKEAGLSLTESILQRFDSHVGFAALVLSPEVAGVGLNITAANHVIHYGRWWNPAKEDQATCRAYRKGQNKAVYLYVPIGIGPNGEESFDKRLDLMLRSKSAMRQDFLTPTGGMDVSNEDAAVLIPGFGESSIQQAQQEGHEFEQLVSLWMRSNGFEQVQVTPSSNDWGSDVLGVKDNRFYLVQCKRQLRTSEDLVEHINQAKTYYGSNDDYSIYWRDRRMVSVVASRYGVTHSVERFFNQKNIEVWHKNW